MAQAILTQASWHSVAASAFGSFTRAAVVKHARDNGNQRRCKVWRRYSGKGRHQNDWEIQVSCYQSVLRHSRGTRPSPEVSPRSEKSSCRGGMKIMLLSDFGQYMFAIMYRGHRRCGQGPQLFEG